MVASMHNPAADALAAAVALLRKAAGLNQRQLAAALGREQNFVARIETGQRRLDLIDWISICRACGADPDVEVTRLLKAIAPLVPRKRPRKAH
jgi:transcriptional regulator with XRE-family HTH domain